MRGDAADMNAASIAMRDPLAIGGLLDKLVG
jgi:hypothetical protein